MAAAFTDCSGTQVTPNVIVSKNGDGNYPSLTEAVRNIPGNVQGRYVIYVKAGVYDENVVISKPNITLVGDGIGMTVIRSNLSNGGGTSILDSGAVIVLADNFIGRCITFENISGAEKEQAVALRSDGDKSVFYRCEFLGYQDTLYVNGGRQFFRECNIYGSVDFIFGDARMVLQNCNIRFRKPKGTNVITAQGREEEAKNTGIIIHCCDISVASGFNMGAKKGYLGRPWKAYSRTVIMKSFIDDVIDPSGWLDMNGNKNTAQYSEYDNTGAGASTANRVKWPGYKVIGNMDEAKPYTVGVFIDGNEWLPLTGVPFNLGLEYS